MTVLYNTTGLAYLVGLIETVSCFVVLIGIGVLIDYVLHRIYKVEY